MAVPIKQANSNTTLVKVKLDIPTDTVTKYTFKYNTC